MRLSAISAIIPNCWRMPMDNKLIKATVCILALLGAMLLLAVLK